MTVMRGRAWKFGDNVLNDGGIMTLEMTRIGEFDPAALARHCMVGLDPDFPKKVKPNDVIVAGRQFGKGQLHVQGPLGIKGLGVGLVTESMTRNFFRLAVSAGVSMLPVVPGATAGIDDGDTIEVDFVGGVIHNVSKGTQIKGEPMPEFLWEFIHAGGERKWLAAKYGAKSA
jgi:3-isopropylmalate/(R)-2-methylmalate dehydratase small subunit